MKYITSLFLSLVLCNLHATVDPLQKAERAEQFENEEPQVRNKGPHRSSKKSSKGTGKYKGSIREFIARQAYLFSLNKDVSGYDSDISESEDDN